jgi:hypothetical protein
MLPLRPYSFTILQHYERLNMIATTIPLFTLLIPICSALDIPRGQVDLLKGSLEIQKKFEALKSTVDAFHLPTPEGSCPVCEEGAIGDGIVKRALSKASRMIRRSSTFSDFSKASRTPLGRRHFRQKVSANTITPIFLATGSRFAALAASAKDLKSNAFKSHLEGDSIEDDMFHVLEVVCNSSATIAFDIANAMGSAPTVSSGLVATSVLSLLGFFERVNLSTMSVLVYYLSRLMGDNETNASALPILLSAELADGVFDEMLDFLASNGDMDASGLTSIAPESEAINNRLQQFISTADAFTARRSCSVERPFAGNTMVKAANLISGNVLTIVSMVNSIALDIVPKIGVVAGSMLGLMLGSVDSILKQNLSVFNSIFGIFSTEAKRSSVSGETLLLLWCLSWIDDNDGPPTDDLNDNGGYVDVAFCFLIGLLPIAIITSPIWVPLLIIQSVISSIFNILGILFGTGRRSDSRAFSCEMEAMTCYNEALAAALPRI